MPYAALTMELALFTGTRSDTARAGRMQRRGPMSRELKVMSKSVVNDLDVQALVDGELTGDEQERVLAAIRHNPVLKSRYEQLKTQRRMIAAAWMQEETESLH